MTEIISIPVPRICRACGTDEDHEYLGLTNGFIENTIYQTLECRKCGTMQTGVANPDQLSEIYNGIYKYADVISGYKRYRAYHKLSNCYLTKNIFNIFFAEQIYCATYFLIKEIEKELGYKPRILEVGSGLGYVTRQLRKDGYDVVGSDLSDHACKKAHQDYGGKFICGDASKILEIEGATFDAVICLEVLEHVDDPSGFLRSYRQILKTNGSIIITTPNKRGMHAWSTTEPPVHMTYFSLAGVAAVGLNIGAKVSLVKINITSKNLQKDVDTPLPGAVFNINMTPNYNYFDYGPMSKWAMIKLILKNIINRVRYKKNKLSIVPLGQYLSSDSQASIIARYHFI